MTNKAIQLFRISRLLNEPHLQFHVDIDTLLTQTGVETHGIIKLCEIYQKVIAEEKEALNYIGASQLTVKLNLCDGKRSQLLRGFINTIEGNAGHFIEAISNDGVMIRNVINHYGNINKRASDAKTAAINDLVRELSNVAYAEAIDRLHLREWLTKIIEANATYHSLAMDRYDEIALRTPHRMRTCRPETDRMYHAMVNDVEIQVLVGRTTPGMTECIARWNVIVSHYKTLLAREHPKSETEKTSAKASAPAVDSK